MISQAKQSASRLYQSKSYMPKPRVIIVINKLNRGGAEKQLLLILQKLKEDFDFEIVTIYGEGEFEKPFLDLQIPIAHHNLKGHLWRPKNLFAIARISWNTFRKRPHIVHAWLFHSNLVAALHKLSYPSVTLISSVRNTHYSHSKFHRLVDRFIYSASNKIITNSNEIKQEIAQLCRSEDKIDVIYNGIDLTNISLKPATSDKTSSLEKETIYVGCVARFVAQKRYGDIIDAAKLVRARHQNVKFILVGGRGRFEMYRQMVAESELKNYITLIGEVENPIDYIENFDIFLMASSYEGMPNSLMEAMSLGKPVVATDIPSISYLITSEVNGLLVPVGQPQEICEGISRLVEDKTLREKFGLANTNAILAYSSTKMAANYKTLYESFLS